MPIYDKPDKASTSSQPAKELRIYLLGDLRVIWDNLPDPNLPHRVHNLLAALLLHPRPLHREHLVGLLFSDTPEQTGRSRLSDLLWHLRRSLPNLPLETGTQEVYLPPQCRWLDVEVFREAAAQKNLDDWMEALALYKGNLLERLYDDWLVEERESLYLQFVHLSHCTCNELLKQQRYDDVLPIAEHLVQAESYDEAALRTLMKVYRGLGRRGAALAAYDRFLSLAVNELGTEPDAATQTLAQALRNEDIFVLHTETHALSPSALPQALLQQAHQAAACGDAHMLKALKTQLQRIPASIDPVQICLLEIDQAMCSEQYERAAQLLAECSSSSAPFLVRRSQLAFHQRHEAEAQEIAAEALIMAHDSGDQWDELDALLILSQAQRRLGQYTQSTRSAERALKLAQNMGSPAHIAQAIKSKGYTLYRQGRDTEALSLLFEMRSLAHEHGLRSILAEALRGIAVIYDGRRAWPDALRTYQEELSIWRDLGLRSREAQTLHNLAIVQAALGKISECLHTLEQARQLCEQLNDPVETAINQYNVADTLIHHDDANAPRAITMINQVLDIFRYHRQQGWEAAALSTLGCALWIQNQHQAALEAFQQAHDLYEAMGEMPFLSEMLAYQAFAYLGLKQPEQALALSRSALLSMAQGEGFEEATSIIYYAHAQALAANNQADQALNYLERAYRRLLSDAAQLEDEPARQAFFSYHPITRRVMQQVYAAGIAPAPAAGMITRQLPGRQRRSAVPVRLTLDAGPADAALKQTQGAIGLRRARLARLLQESQAQGAKPTLNQLAEILDVSMRTIKRDLAVLRQAHQ